MSATTRMVSITAALDAIDAAWTGFWRERWTTELKDAVRMYHVLNRDGVFSDRRDEISKRIRRLAMLLNMSVDAAMKLA